MLSNIVEAQDDVARLGTVAAADADLEGPNTLPRFGRLSVDDAVRSTSSTA